MPVSYTHLGRVSECGHIDDDRLLQAKGHFFSLNDLLAEDKDLTETFKNGEFVTTYLSPVSYTHLDVYKRQVLFLAYSNNKLKLKKGSPCVHLVLYRKRISWQLVPVADNASKRVHMICCICLLYTSRCV